MFYYYNIPHGSYYKSFADLLNNQQHILIAGATGSGKSVFLNQMLLSAMLTKYPYDNDVNGSAQFIFIDPKGVDLMAYEHLPHALYYTDSMAGAVDALKLASVIINERKIKMKTERWRNYPGTPVFVVIDELADLLLSENGKEILKLLQHIAQIGRAERVFLIMCSQSPSRKILKPELVLNANIRIALRCNSPIESRQILDVAGAEKLPKHGIAIVRNCLDIYKMSIPMIDDNIINKVSQNWELQKLQAQAKNNSY